MATLYVRPGHAPRLEAEHGGQDGAARPVCGHTGRVRALCPCGAPGLGEWADWDTVQGLLLATCVTIRPPAGRRPALT